MKKFADYKSRSASGRKGGRTFIGASENIRFYANRENGETFGSMNS